MYDRRDCSYFRSFFKFTNPDQNFKNFDKMLRGTSKKHRLAYYHTGKFKNLSDYKRRKIEKEIFAEIIAKPKNENYVRPGSFDEISIDTSLQQP